MHTYISELDVVITSEHWFCELSYWWCRLAGDARVLNSSSGCGSQLLCAHTEGRFDRHCNLSSHWLLPAPRAHPGIRWLQEFLHKEPWNIQHSWNYPFVSLPCLGSGSPLPLGICPCWTCCWGHPGLELLPMSCLWIDIRILYKCQVYNFWVVTGLPKGWICWFSNSGEQED